MMCQRHGLVNLALVTWQNIARKQTCLSKRNAFVIEAETAMYIFVVGICVANEWLVEA